jgi:arginyl-tRNA synthetase
MEAFEKAGYDKDFGRVVVSARPDLCQYQVNGAMSGAKQYHKAPQMIANDVMANISENEMIENVSLVAPGFINITVKDRFLTDYMQGMLTIPECGFEKTKAPQTIVFDYGGPNVAKPLHVGHLRSAVIGEALKRMNKFYGHKVIADIHLGDFGLQMGLIIHELSVRRPELCYFDESYQGEYPETAPFDLKDLEEIYPYASAKSKEDEAYLAAARQATVELQEGRSGYRALWKHIMNVSLPDLKRNYQRLDVDFDYWLGESDADTYIPAMVNKMKDDGFAYISEGALVVDVKEDTDTAPIPPCIILKSDGSAIYETTDLATLVQREKDFNPDRVAYVVDKRQSLHFERVFRCAKKTGVVKPETELSFIGFGTVNGKDGKPFKTRSGGTMKLSEMLDLVENAVNIKDADQMNADEVLELKKIIGLAAVKYGDLMNPIESNYIFDLDKFASFEGNTGPYILYTMVRIKSILAKLREKNPEAIKGAKFGTITSASERDLALSLTRFSHTITEAVKKDAPSMICSYVYEVANKFNVFYHDKKILAEENETALKSLVALIQLTLNTLDIAIQLLGFKAPEKM